jgi:hypothetical protein
MTGGSICERKLTEDYGLLWLERRGPEEPDVWPTSPVP